MTCFVRFLPAFCLLGLLSFNLSAQQMPTKEVLQSCRYPYVVTEVDSLELRNWDYPGDVLKVVPKGETIYLHATDGLCWLGSFGDYTGLIPSAELTKDAAFISWQKKNISAASGRCRLELPPHWETQRKNLEETLVREKAKQDYRPKSTVHRTYRTNSSANSKHKSTTSKSSTTGSGSKSTVHRTYRSRTTPSYHSTATRCTGYTQKGGRCKRMTKSASGRCWQH